MMEWMEDVDVLGGYSDDNEGDYYYYYYAVYYVVLHDDYDLVLYALYIYCAHTHVEWSRRPDNGEQLC